MEKKLIDSLKGLSRKQLAEALDAFFGQIKHYDQFGFASRNYFHVFFKKHIGMTPEQYRHTHWKAT